MVRVWGRRACAATAVLAGLLVGCASFPPLPDGIDLQRTAVEPIAVAPDVQLDEAGWTSPSARTGGLAGAGLGLGLGGAACIGTGFLAPLCLATVVPLTTAVGAVGGAAVGAAYSHRAEGVEDKRALLQQEWTALAGRAPLADALQRRWQVPARGDAAPPAPAPAPTWHLQVGYATLGTLGRGVDQPFSLQATARLAVWPASDPRRRVERTYVAQSAERLTEAQWRADDAAALRRSLDALADTLATKISEDLTQSAR